MNNGNPLTLQPPAARWAGAFVVLALTLGSTAAQAINPCHYDEWDSYGAEAIGLGCDGLPEIGCCTGQWLVFCADDGETVCKTYCNGPCALDLDADKVRCALMELPWTMAPCADHPRCQCEGRECGPNGCAGSCGTCPADEPVCTAEGHCVACAPHCDGKTCGGDGCGGSCGSCPAGAVCSGQGACCSPDCSTKQCGPDGCGGTCGSCAPGSVCTAGGLCAEQPEGCDPGTSQGCASCGCEECVCSQDSFCCSIAWDVSCALHCDECGSQCSSPACVPNCHGAVCGPWGDGCGGSCGDCPPGTRCSEVGDKCIACTCAHRECGDDGCGTSCGSCEDWQTCAAGRCVPRGCAPLDQSGCGACGCETCVCDAIPSCCTDEWTKECADFCWMQCGQFCPCMPRCEGRECGNDQCGSKCGTCPKNHVCTPDGLCCTPSCEGKECGFDGCRSTCGECAPNSVCVDGSCVCVPICTGKVCGSDGCGGSCGDCASGQVCADGQCLPEWPGSCLGPATPSAATCPPDVGLTGCCEPPGRAVWRGEDGALYCSDCQGCGLGCGFRQTKPDGTPAGYHDCGAPAELTPAGVACGTPCIPTCAGKDCGPDGCGGFCPPGCAMGTCVDGQCSSSAADVFEQGPDAGDDTAEPLADAHSAEDGETGAHQDAGDDTAEPLSDAHSAEDGETDADQDAAAPPEDAPAGFLDALSPGDVQTDSHQDAVPLEDASAAAPDAVIDDVPRPPDTHGVQPQEDSEVTSGADGGPASRSDGHGSADEGGVSPDASMASGPDAVADGQPAPSHGDAAADTADRPVDSVDVRPRASGPSKSDDGCSAARGLNIPLWTVLAVLLVWGRRRRSARASG